MLKLAIVDFMNKNARKGCIIIGFVKVRVKIHFYFYPELNNQMSNVLLFFVEFEK